jgi:ATP-dependent Zn protease
MNPGKPPSQRDNRKSHVQRARRARSGHGSDESCSPADIRATAYHEAGHAVAATVLGVGLVSVDIKGHSSLEKGALGGAIKVGDYLGFTRYVSGDGMEMQRRSLEDPEFCRTMMVVTSAGPSAEAAVLRDEELQSGYDEDGDRVFKLAVLACCGGDLQPDGQVLTSVSEVRRQLVKIEAMSNACFYQTEVFLRDHWAAVKAVAMELLEAKSLTGAEVAEIVEAAMVTVAS